MSRRVLVIDDQFAKYEAIEAFFTEKFPEDSLTWIKNFRQAQSNLTKLRFDLVVLDMSFDVHAAESEDSSFNGLSGLHVLQFMWRSKIYIPVIICTSHSKYSDPEFGVLDSIDALRSHVKLSFGDTVLGCVRMGSSEASWKRELEELVRNERK